MADIVSDKNAVIATEKNKALFKELKCLLQNLKKSIINFIKTTLP